MLSTIELVKDFILLNGQLVKLSPKYLFIPKDKCFPQPRSKKLLFSANGS